MSTLTLQCTSAFPGSAAGTVHVGAPADGTIHATVTYSLTEADVTAVLFSGDHIAEELSGDSECQDPREVAAKRLLECLVSPAGPDALALTLAGEASGNPAWTKACRDAARVLFAGGEAVSGLLDTDHDVQAVSCEGHAGGLRVARDAETAV